VELVINYCPADPKFTVDHDQMPGIVAEHAGHFPSRVTLIFLIR
jgi:hypothetical protein